MLIAVASLIGSGLTHGLHDGTNVSALAQVQKSEWNGLYITTNACEALKCVLDLANQNSIEWFAVAY